MLADFESFPEWASIVGAAAPGRWQALASSSAWRGLATEVGALRLSVLTSSLPLAVFLFPGIGQMAATFGGQIGRAGM